MDQNSSGGEPPAGERTSPDGPRAAPITDEEVRQRRAHTYDTVENARLDGLIVDSETRKIMDTYDRGEIEADEMIRQVLSRHVPKS